MITLHHLENSRSQRILWLLEELGVEYDVKHYKRDAKTSLAPPELLKVHPLGKSPVITDGDITVAESGAIVEYLVKHSKVQRVLWPGLPDHPGHELQKRQASGFGAMITLEMGSFAAAKAMLDRVRLMAFAESLGGVETLISHPASMTHASVPPERRAELGLTEGMVRISVGIEDVNDLLADLDQSLAAV